MNTTFTATEFIFTKTQYKNIKSNLIENIFFKKLSKIYQNLKIFFSKNSIFKISLKKSKRL